MELPRISRVFGAVNVGSFRISAMIMGQTETEELVVIGSGHRASQGIKRGCVVDMAAATYAIRDAVERAEKVAGTDVPSVWIGSSGAGLASQISKVEMEIGGRRIEEEDIEFLLLAARDNLQPDGRMVLHAHPAHYTLDSDHIVNNPKGLYAERLGVDVHVMQADGPPIRNLIEAVQNAHLDVAGVVATPIAAGYACLTPEERDLRTAMIEIGGEVTSVSLYAGGLLRGLKSIPLGAVDITDSIASSLGIRRFQAERLKCVAGSAIASPADNSEMIPVDGPGQQADGPVARGADDRNCIPRAELVTIVTDQLSILSGEIGQALREMDFASASDTQIVLSGGGAELAGIAEYLQSALGRPVRVGKPPSLRGMPEAHANPGFATLAGLCLYAVDDPVDIRSIARPRNGGEGGWGMGTIRSIIRAAKEYF